MLMMHTCTPALPACGAPGVVSVSTIVQDLAAADVQAAFSLAAPPVYGVDERPEDGQVWSIVLAGAGAGAGRIFVGGPCPSPIMDSYRPIPAGVQRLADDLKSLAVRSNLRARGCEVSAIAGFRAEIGSRSRFIGYFGGVTSSEFRRACGQLLSVGFDGPSPPPELIRRIARSEVGGVMLFRPNVETPAQVAGLVRALREASPTEVHLVVSVDQEGGRVQRLRAPLTPWPDMFSVAAAGDVRRTRVVGAALGREIAALGIGWNFAPVLDVNTNPNNPVIGDRAFGNHLEVVEDHALAFWRGLHDADVLGCGKHFPGHGDTHADSHLELPRVDHDNRRLHSVELASFATAVRAGMEALMTAHVLYPAWDAKLPATLSRRIAHDILRGELGFAGMLVSDDLGMRAVADHYAVEDLVVESLLAGVDHFLVREPIERQTRAFAALVKAGEARTEVRERIEESAARVARFKAKLRVPMPAAGDALLAQLGTPENQALAASFVRVIPFATFDSPVVDA
jgi:beta-N-acetylhexosaminidase